MGLYAISSKALRIYPRTGGGKYTSIDINVADGSLVPTAGGEKSFNVYKAAGTMSAKASESRFKIQYSKGGGMQWHANGIQRFTTKSGTVVLGFTHRTDAEAVLFKDPYTYADGGKILQRFGTPAGGSGNRYFGLKSSEQPFTTGVHNVFYTRSSASLGGAESISLFVNSEANATNAAFPPGGALAQAYEFAIALKDEGASGDPGDDTVFATKYVRAPCTFYAQNKGGARAIGNGVFIVASGADSAGLQVTDVSGKTKSHGYSGGSVHLYDPFVRVVA